MGEFDAFFRELTEGCSAPHEWQRSLGVDPDPRSRLIRIPTGMGKTLGVLAAWSWHRLQRRDERWPRRLVWCLPMRVLVEQTEAVVREILERQGLLWDGASDHAGKVGAHLLMGGADAGGDWNLYPEECAVLVGTQDMLLSRALNRGYGAARARWPHEFGLLNHDVLWVMDEAQLMDVGLATSAQLQAYFDEDAAKGLRPRLTWWMSATLQPAWLRSVDTAPVHESWERDPTLIPPAQRGDALNAIRKELVLTTIGAGDAAAFARRVLDEHERLGSGEHGRITLVICNTVHRACELFQELAALAPTRELKLVHSRFRPAERAAWRGQFLSRAACAPGADRIIVATQVVEAGVDISAGCVVTELAPWPSLVQRFGRCARYGGSGRAVVVDRGREGDSVLPYSAEELEASWRALEKIAAAGGDVGTASLESFEEALEQPAREALYPYRPAHLLLRRELYELFDTTPDLSGADLDISRFIRTGDERDLQVFWLEVPRPSKADPRPVPSDRHRPRREELCSIPFLLARDWLCGEETRASRRPRLRTGKRAWVWDWLDGRWSEATRAELIPGRIVCVAADSGGYREDRGFDPGSYDVVCPLPPAPLKMEDEIQLVADESEDSEALSAARWKTIACHATEVARLLEDLARALDLRSDLLKTLLLAARWHDVGKAHPAFQGAIRLPDRPVREDLAKAPKEAWPKPPDTYRSRDDRDQRPGLRHELASALALFAVLQRYAPRHPALLGPWVEVLELMGQPLPDAPAHSEPGPNEQAVLACSAEEFDLLAYLVASHHGKVRVALHAGPKDQEHPDSDGRGLPIRGVREGDVIPPIAIDAAAPALPPLALTLEPATLGLSPRTGRSWHERTLDLVDRFGPGALAWLEVLLAAADRRASALQTPDPAFACHEEALP